MRGQPQTQLSTAVFRTAVHNSSSAAEWWVGPPFYCVLLLYCCSTFSRLLLLCARVCVSCFHVVPPLGGLCTALYRLTSTAVPYSSKRVLVVHEYEYWCTSMQNVILVPLFCCLERELEVSYPPASSPCYLLTCYTQPQCTTGTAVKGTQFTQQLILQSAVFMAASCLLSVSAV